MLQGGGPKPSTTHNSACFTMGEQNTEKETDITIYGATSFVAKHVIRYLLEVYTHQKFRLTLGGRNGSKLLALKESFSSSHVNGAMAIGDTCVASGSDLPALKKMAERSKVVLNCAGPYALYSSLVVAACADVGTDYVDIAGEPEWVANMRQTYGKAAKSSGARIISLCGYDSVPSDIAVFAAVEALKVRCGASTDVESAKLWHQMFGMPNGGTIYTLIESPVDPVKDFTTRSDEGSMALRGMPHFVGDPLILASPTKVRHNPEYDDTKFRLAKGEWLNQLIHLDSNFSFGVSLPMPMAAINLKVVQASSVALNYGKEFTARERYLPMGFSYTRIAGLLGLLPAVFIHFCTLCLVVVLRLPFIGKKLADIFIPPGSGSPDMLCDIGSNAVYAVATAKSETGDGTVNRGYAYLSFQGDAGNLVTAQCVSEAALALVFDREALPTRSEDGFGTPAELLGGCLLKRIRETKVRPVEMNVTVRTGAPRNELTTYMH